MYNHTIKHLIPPSFSLQSKKHTTITQITSFPAHHS